jgi:ribosomal RNA-processing protein 12
MIRKFGYDDIYRFAGEGDEKKVLVGIRRKKERAKKKRAGGDGEDGEEVCLFLLLLPSGASASKSELDSRIGTKLTLQVKKTSSGNAFDDILYNSDSDLESEDDTPSAPVVNATRGKGPQASQTTLYQQRPGGKKDPKQKDKEPKKREGQSFIRGDGDEPLDLLSRSIAGNVASESGLSFLLLLPLPPAVLFYFLLLQSKSTVE